MALIGIVRCKKILQSERIRGWRMTNTIFHVDMDAFFTSVEQRDRPELRGLPVVVGAPADRRGVVAAASYEARRYGIHSAMPSREAFRRCPHAVFLPVNMSRYVEASKRIHAIFDRYTPWVQRLSIDEAFLDVTGSLHLFGTAIETAQLIKDDIRRETGLTASVGVGPNPFLAKLASDMQKPDGLTITPRDPDEIIAFLAPLPVERLWGVGKIVGSKLTTAGICTIGDLQWTATERLARLVGQHAALHLQSLARGEDDRDIHGDRDEEKSISREHTFAEDCVDQDRLRHVLFDLVEDVAQQLRANGIYAGCAVLKLRDADFSTITRQCSLSPPLCDNHSLRQTAEDLFNMHYSHTKIRLIGFGVSRLHDDIPKVQLTLFDDQEYSRKKEQISQAVDRIRRSYGKDSIRRGGRSHNNSQV